MIEEKSCAARMEKVTGTFSFTVEGWSALPDKIGESTESPEFELCGRSWQLRIFPGGSLDAHVNYVSFYLASKSTTMTRASYKLLIKNQNNGSNDEVFASAGIRKFEAKGIQVDGWGRDKFIAASQLRDAWVGLCVNDTVVFKVEVTVFGGLTPITQCLANGVPVSTLAQSLQRALEDPCGTFADVSLCLDSEVLEAHKSVLCARSPVFRAMFHSQMAEAVSSRVHIEGIELPVMRELLNFMYTDVIR
jgi:speckle-type POZ protein